MLTLRPSAQRGYNDFGWLKTYHSFSFGHYFDPKYMNFGALRVINDDKIEGGAGFATHPHDNMEIVTYVLSGALAHKDSLGNGSIIQPGDVQRMSAGTGITHSEYNHMPDQETHLLQIWFKPANRDIPPSYEQKQFTLEQKRGKLRLVASQTGREGSVSLNQDVDMYATVLEPGQQVKHSLAAGRKAWLQVAKGSAVVNGMALVTGDGVAIENEPELTVQGDGELVLFDLGN